MPGPRRRPTSLPTGQGWPSVYLAIEGTPVMRLSRTLDNRSWEAGVYGAMYRANLAIAREGQRRAVGLLERSIVRPSQRTGRLEDAVADPQAIYADAQRIILGVGDYLDRVARYWRPVEEGAPGLAGRIVFGFWTNAPRFDGGAVQLGPPQRGVRTGRPIVLAWDEPPDRRRYFRWTASNIPEGKFFFLRAWQSVSVNFVEATYRRELTQVSGPNGRPLQLGRLFRARTGRTLARADFGF